MKEDWGRLLRFLAVGGLNTSVGFGLYAGFVLLGLGEQWALLAATLLGVLWNYITHGRLVFDSQGGGHLLPYIAAYGLLYLINASALKALTCLGTGPLLAQALLVLPMAAAAFLLISVVLTGRLPFSHKLSGRTGRK
ncbi:MAG: GtrA family protein [Rhodobacteraceae bacterium]|nr:GtrA family protein [Paracoccaceae bacterium]